MLPASISCWCVWDWPSDHGAERALADAIILHCLMLCVDVLWSIKRIDLSFKMRSCARVKQRRWSDLLVVEIWVGRIERDHDPQKDVFKCEALFQFTQKKMTSTLYLNITCEQVSESPTSLNVDDRRIWRILIYTRTEREKYRDFGCFWSFLSCSFEFDRSDALFFLSTRYSVEYSLFRTSNPFRTGHAFAPFYWHIQTTSNCSFMRCSRPVVVQ